MLGIQTDISLLFKQPRKKEPLTPLSAGDFGENRTEPSTSTFLREWHAEEVFWVVEIFS